MSNENNVALLHTLLGVLFIGLKLTGVIDWPWVRVLAPLWVPAVIGIVVLIIVAIWLSRE